MTTRFLQWLVLAPAIALATIRGIPKDAAHYTNIGHTFACLNGEGSFLVSAVNDDYCDCSDGSDEPGTAACNQAKFYCLKDEAYISSSNVGDGVCDCCDGSDEAVPDVNNSHLSSATTCPHTCKGAFVLDSTYSSLVQWMLEQKGSRMSPSSMKLGSSEQDGLVAARFLKEGTKLFSIKPNIFITADSLAHSHVAVLFRENNVKVEGEGHGRRSLFEEGEVDSKMSLFLVTEKQRRLAPVDWTAEVEEGEVEGESLEEQEENKKIWSFCRTFMTGQEKEGGPVASKSEWDSYLNALPHHSTLATPLFLTSHHLQVLPPSSHLLSHVARLRHVARTRYTRLMADLQKHFPSVLCGKLGGGRFSFPEYAWGLSVWAARTGGPIAVKGVDGTTGRKGVQLIQALVPVTDFLQAAYSVEQVNTACAMNGKSTLFECSTIVDVPPGHPLTVLYRNDQGQAISSSEEFLLTHGRVVWGRGGKNNRGESTSAPTPPVFPLDLVQLMVPPPPLKQPDAMALLQALQLHQTTLLLSRPPSSASPGNPHDEAGVIGGGDGATKGLHGPLLNYCRILTCTNFPVSPKRKLSEEKIQEMRMRLLDNEHLGAANEKRALLLLERTLRAHYHSTYSTSLAEDENQWATLLSSLSSQAQQENGIRCSEWPGRRAGLENDTLTTTTSTTTTTGSSINSNEAGAPLVFPPICALARRQAVVLALLINNKRVVLAAHGHLRDILWSKYQRMTERMDDKTHPGLTAVANTAQDENKDEL